MNRLLILYDYFDPAFKAGGPTRSLVNLVGLMEKELDIYILTTNQDHDRTLLDVEPDQWISYGTHAHVKYLSKENRSYKDLKSVIHELRPTTVYINGMYSMPFVVFPLAVLRNQSETKVVMAPRGMLQTQALALKPWKKKIYLTILKWFFLHGNIQWHVTTEQEKSELLQAIDKPKRIALIGNVPNFQVDISAKTRKRENVKILGTVALISPMKNIHLVLKALMEIKDELVYELFGPIKDQEYWDSCQKIIQKLPANIFFSYKGEITPEEVSSCVQNFDFYIQPSKSENFGHSIFEAFNQGVPVIISDQTPWKGLKEKQAGWDVDLKDEYALVSAIQEAIALDDSAYLSYCKGARRMAEAYIDANDFRAQYLRLLS